VAKKISESKPDRGRMGDLHWDGWKVLKWIHGRWRLKYGDRTQWKQMNEHLQFKEAKALRQPYSQWRK